MWELGQMNVYYKFLAVYFFIEIKFVNNLGSKLL